MNKYEIGTKHQTKNCGSLEIVGKDGWYWRTVRFDDTGTIMRVRTSALRSGSIRDPYAKTVLGVGFSGELPEEFEKHPHRRMLYTRWHNMLTRVHVLNTGKTIAPEWYCFATFMKDVLQLPGAELLTTHSAKNRIDLDSDIISMEKGFEPTYSKETCQWVSHKENMKYRKSPVRHLNSTGTVYQTKFGPVQIVRTADGMWLIEFEDGSRRWAHPVCVRNGQVRIPAPFNEEIESF